MPRNQTTTEQERTETIDVLCPITPSQQRFIEGLLSGRNISEAAIYAGIARRTACYWLHDVAHPVRCEYEKQRSDLRQGFHDRIASLHEQALAALEFSLSAAAPPWIRFSAAKFLYEAHLKDYATIAPAPTPADLVDIEIKGLDESMGRGQALDIYLYDDKGRDRRPDY